MKNVLNSRFGLASIRYNRAKGPDKIITVKNNAKTNTNNGSPTLGKLPITNKQTGMLYMRTHFSVCKSLCLKSIDGDQI